MILKEFPDLGWLKQQIKTRFENRRRWDGARLKHAGWPNVILQVKTGEVYRDHVEGPFSLFGNLSGQSRVTVDGRTVKVDDDHFFLSNQNQLYTLETGKKDLAETFNIHFGEHFADQAVRSLGKPESLLDNVDEPAWSTLAFHNRLIHKTPRARAIIEELRTNTDDLLEEEKLHELFRALYSEELDLKMSGERLPSLRKSTRDEVLKRILLSVDYIYSYYDTKLSLEGLARASCLSKFHFLRLFKIAMGMTPHQFITHVRLEKATGLLRAGKLDIHRVAREVGFENASSFSRLFYHQTGSYPTQFRLVRK